MRKTENADAGYFSLSRQEREDQGHVLPVASELSGRTTDLLREGQDTGEMRGCSASLGGELTRKDGQSCQRISKEEIAFSFIPILQ